MAADRRPDPAPYQTNDYAPAIAGTILWAIAAVVLAFRHDDMAANGDGWWVWVAVVGVGIGLWGMVMVAIHHRVGRRRAQRGAPETAETTATAETTGAAEAADRG